MNSSVLQLISIRFKEFIREPEIVFWSIIFPVAMAWVLGVAFSQRSELTQTIALVRNSPSSDTLLQGFLNSSEPITDTTSKDTVAYLKEIENDKLGKTVYRFVPVRWDTALLMIKRGETSIILKESSDSLQYYFDPKNPDAKLNYLILSGAINNEKFINETGNIQTLTRAGTRYIDYLVPGLIALGIMNSLLWGISYTLIEMRSKKLLRRMIATPMKKTQFLFSHFTARLTLSTIEASILYAFSYGYFKISVQGSIVALIMMFLAGNIFFTGISVLISSRTSNSRVGTGLINFVSMPMMILSGIFFSYHNFPDFVVPVIQKLPLTILADSIRSIFIEGAQVFDIMPDFLILTILGLILSYLGLRIFKWY